MMKKLAAFLMALAMVLTMGIGTAEETASAAYDIEFDGIVVSGASKSVVCGRRLYGSHPPG